MRMQLCKKPSRSAVLAEPEYLRLRSLAEAYLHQHKSITNRELRGITRLTYDQAIAFLNHMCEEKRLVKRGRFGGTHYIRA